MRFQLPKRHGMVEVRNPENDETIRVKWALATKVGVHGWVYANRASGRDRDYRHPGGATPASANFGEGKSAAHFLPQQPAAAWAGLTDVRRG